MDSRWRRWNEQVEGEEKGWMREVCLMVWSRIGKLFDLGEWMKRESKEPVL